MLIKSVCLEGKVSIVFIKIKNFFYVPSLNNLYFLLLKLDYVVQVVKCYFYKLT